MHRDLSWKTDPGGLIKKAEQTVYFLKEAEEKPLSAALWGSRAALLQTEKGFRISSQLSKGSLAALCRSWRLMQPQVIPPPTLAVWPADPWKVPENPEITDEPAENSFYRRHSRALKNQSNFRHSSVHDHQYANICVINYSLKYVLKLIHPRLR